MAQWRKVIVSGSSAVLNQISASGNIVPTSDNGVDLGSSTLEFKDLYIDGTANVDSLSADTAAIGDLTSGRVVFAGGSGELQDDSDFTFATDTLTATKIGAFEAAGAIDFSDEAMTNVDINSGAIDGTTIGAASHTTIKGTTIDATTDFTIGGTVITDNTITDDGTLVIASTTATSFSDGNITNVGSIALDSIAADDGSSFTISNNWTNAGNTIADLGTVTTATSITSTDLIGTNVDGILGADTARAITGTTITANTGVVPDANDGAYLGQAGTAFSDLFLAEGGVINWDSGDATLTQASNVVTLAGATLTGTLTNGLSVTANGGIGMTSYNASAAVADLALDIDGMTDIGAAIASGDLIIVDDGAGGTNRKSTIDRVATLFAGTGLTATSAVIAIDAADTTTTSIINASLGKIGTNASQEYITFGTSDEVNTFIDNSEVLSVRSGGVDITGVATVSSNLTVGGNLDVNGTLTTIDTTNSYVADKFMIIASGSTSATDGGIIVQNSAGAGYALGYDSGTSRWVLDNNLTHNATDITPDTYVGTVELGTTDGDSQSAPTYGSGVGSIYVDTDDAEIWIYA